MAMGCKLTAPAACPGALLCADATKCATTCTANSTTGCASGYYCDGNGTACKS
jgi:hypothetical protein